MNLEHVNKRIDEINTDGKINTHYIKGLIKLFNNQAIPDPAIFPAIEDLHGLTLRWVIDDKNLVVNIDFNPKDTVAYTYDRTTRQWEDGTLFEKWDYIQHLLSTNYFEKADWVKMDALPIHVDNSLNQIGFVNENL